MSKPWSAVVNAFTDPNEARWCAEQWPVASVHFDPNAAQWVVTVPKGHYDRFVANETEAYHRARNASIEHGLHG